VRDEDGVAREGEEAPDGSRHRRRASPRGVAEPRQRRDRGIEARAGVRERREPLAELAPGLEIPGAGRVQELLLGLQSGA
jgi:hypothetical protein